MEGVSPTDVQAYLYMAPNAIDYSGYPDCRPEFYESAVETLNLGSRLFTQYGIRIEVKTPILAMTKADIVRLAVELKVPLELTWSCYKGGEKPCGECDSCSLRAKGFEEAGVEDPALG